VGLDVGVVGAKEGLGPVDGELLHDVDVFAAAVPAFAGVAFGVFVGEAGALGLHDGAAGEVLRRDQLDVLKLPFAFGGDGLGQFGVDLFNAAAGLEFLAHVAELADAPLVPVASFKRGGKEGVGDFLDVLQ